MPGVRGADLGDVFARESGFDAFAEVGELDELAAEAVTVFRVGGGLELFFEVFSERRGLEAVVDLEHFQEVRGVRREGADLVLDFLTVGGEVVGEWFEHWKKGQRDKETEGQRERWRRCRRLIFVREVSLATVAGEAPLYKGVSGP